MNIVPATKDILTRYYGHAPKHTTQAWAAVEGDDVLGVGGVCVNRSRLLVFLGMNDSLRERFRKYPGALVKGVRKLQKLAVEKELVLQAEPDKDIPCAVQFLERMGFSKVKGSEVYVWPGN